MVGSCMGEISTGAQSVARTPMYALAGNCRFCPADPMKKAPTAVLNPLHHCWGPNWHKTTLKKDSMVPHVGTLADDLSCPVQPPSLVQWYSTVVASATVVARPSQTSPDRLPRHQARPEHPRAPPWTPSLLQYFPLPLLPACFPLLGCHP